MKIVRIGNEKAWYIYNKRWYFTGTKFSLLMCDALLFTTLIDAERALSQLMESQPLPDGFSLHCGAFGVELYKQIEVNLRSLGCSLVADNDLFDLGFRVEDLERYGLELRWGSTVLVKWPPLIPDDQPQALPPAHGYGSDTA